MSRRAIAIPEGGFRRIAVIRLSSLGDVILTLPVVHALKAAWPAAKIDFWVKEEYLDVVAHDPAIHHVRVLERDARRIEDIVSMSEELTPCDLIVDLHVNVRTRLLAFRHTAAVLRAPAYRLLRERWVRARWTKPAPAPGAVARYAEAVAPAGVTVSGVPVVTASTEAEGWARRWVATSLSGTEPVDGSLVAFAPGARHATKQWPEDHWIELHRALRAAGHRVVVLTTAAERKALPRLSCHIANDGGTAWVCEPVGRVAALLSHCRTAVTCDSGLMHLAAARGIKVVALFGSTAPELGFGPAGDGHTVMCRHEPCQPCTLHGRERCPKGHFRCMRLLLPAQVEAAVRAQLD